MRNKYAIIDTKHFKKLLFVMLLLAQAISSFSEGTKQIQPSSGDVGMLVLDNGWSNFAQYGCLPEERLQITTCNNNERIYFGFRYLTTGVTVQYRIKNQSGTVVMGPANIPTSGAGYIGSYNAAVAGPSAIVGASGYNALTYTAPIAGDYYIEFSVPSGTRVEFDYFDITVSNPAGNTAIPGRVWSKSWMLSAGNYGTPFRGKFFVYADDQIVTSLDFNGMAPYVFVLNANKTGTSATGNPAVDQQSKRGKSTYPSYRVFLNDPDQGCFPTGAFGNITAPTTISGCPPSNFCININVNKPGNAQVFLDLNGTPGHQAGTRDRIISATVNPPGGCIPWDGKDGLGNFVTQGFSFKTTVEFYNGLTHIPLYDVEQHPNGYRVALVRPTGPVPKIYWDDSQIPGGTMSPAGGATSPAHTWDWTCCSNGANDYGNTNTINTWWYADSTREITTHFVPPLILADADTRPTGGAGGKNDTLICGTNNTYSLSGGVVTATGGIWSTTGTGNFTPSNTALNGTYNITAADRTAGLVRLVLTTTGNGACAAVRDTLTLRFQPIPTASAGSPATVCANNPSVVLTGSITNAGGGIWSGGTGTFSPSNTTLNATYTPSAAEIAAGNVTLTLTTTGNNKCAPVGSPVPKAITITPSPTVNTGPAQTVCRTTPAITLAGSTTNATSSTWSGGAGTFSPNASTLNATYTPTPAEIAAGTVNLTLSATRAGCATVSANVTMTFGPSPTANAGTDRTVCFNNSDVTLNGAVTNASSFSWSGGSGTFTPNNTTLNAVYTPTLAERTTGSVTLTLTATRSGCTSVSDNMLLTIQAAPTVNAGNDGTVCENRPQYNLTGTSSTGSGQWIGTGTFAPNANVTNPTYTPDAAEIASGVASVIWSSTNNTNGCIAVNDTILIFVTPSPTANAGSDISVCANNPTATITGTRSNASSSLWSGGNGTFAPNTNALAITYIPSATEIANGSVTLTLTASRNTCNSVSDNVVITITPAPTIDAGADQTICYNNPNVNLNGAVTVATGGTWSGGAGTFNPSNQLVTVYTPTTSELNTGTINLTLTSSVNNGCIAVTDQMTIHVTPSPTSNAGTPQSVCANNATVTLNGSKTGAAGGIWSGGAGTFTPNNTTLNATYTPTAAEISAGSTTLTLTTTNQGNCNPVSSNVTIGITPAPTVNAGTDQTVCAANPTITLNGSKTVATGATWSGGSGTFTPNNTTLTASYTPTLGEITAGTVTLRLTTTGNTSNCNAVSDQVTFTIVPAANAQAGADQIICAAGINVALGGSVTGATGGAWTTSGSGTFSPNATTLNASYIPSAIDKTAGTVTLTLTTTGMAPCNANSDQMIISITGVPSISAGPDQIVCSNDFPIQLNGSGSPARWSGGSGTFSNINSLTSTYTPTTAEVNAGSVTLTLTTNPSGACPTVNDNVLITLRPSPIVNAGADFTVCGNLSGAALSGTVTNTVGGFWTTSGTGSFSPNNTTLNATYVPSALDKTNGSVQLTLTSTGSGACSQVTDQMILTIQPTITVTAGPDQTVCADISGISLTGASVSNATGIIWTTAGSGTFLGSATTLNGTYLPSAAERAAGTVTLTISTTGNGTCPVITDNVTFTITPAPIVNAGADQTICADVTNVTLNASNSAGFGILWTTSGTGTFSNTSSTSAIYTPSAADKTAGSVTLTVTSTNNGTCNPVTDNMVLTITPKPTSSAGIDQTVCADIGSIALTSTVTVAGSGTWSTSGNGTFANANSLNTSYTLGSNDITNGIVTLTLTSATNGVCGSSTDQLVVTILDAPIVNAGPDQNICSNNSNVHLLGSVTHATGGVWSGGAGSFSPGNTSLTPNYTPTAAEIASGSVTLSLTSTGNGLCNPKVDQVVINFTPTPTVNAGPDRVICSDSIGIALSGATTVSPTGAWTTSGTGNFFPNSAVANPTYMPSPSDRTSGSVTLTYTSNNNGNCNAVNDQLILTITPAPTLYAGPDQLECGNNANINLAAVKTVAGGIQWTTGGTGTFGNSTADNTTYTPSALDIAAGSVTITGVTTGNGTCRSVTDQLILTITPAPTVNAGSDRTLCANNPDVGLNGSFTVSTGITWTTSGSGVFSPNANNRLAVYTPSPSDISNGTVTLTITTTGNGLCNAVTDQMIITITPAPVISAGSDRTVCADVSGVSLNGSITNAGGVIWTSNGTGTFSPNATALNAAYNPSPADTIAKSVRLVITSTGIGNCLVVRDTMFITILPKPIVNAGKDTIVCANAEFVNLSGFVANATGGTWTSNGSGYFTPNANTLNAQYIPSGAETMGGTVTLTLTSTGMGTCNPVSDQMVIILTPLPTANAGPDQTLCSNNAVVTINGTITNSSGASWVSSGDGTFANANALSTTYTPSANDIASGSINLTLTTNGSSVCHANSDQLTLSFTPAPVVNAGADQTICENNSNVNLNGIVTVASGGTWTTTGSGTFTPSITALNAIYHPSAADINSGAGSVTLTLTSTGNGSCTSVANQMQVNFTPAPTVNAGADQSICANNATVTLNGVVTVATSGRWTTSGTGTFANINAVATTYTPSASDIIGGTITLTLRSRGNGNCSAVSDQLVITITPAPTINAGPDQTICANNTNASISGTVSVATGATWSTSGTGTFGNVNSLTTTYTPSPADTVAKVVTLTLTSTGNGNCAQVIDQMVLNITPAPKTNAGLDQTLCSNNASSISLTGSISVASGGTWTSSGTGTFTNNNSLSTSYTPSAADISSTSTTLTLTSTGNGTCSPVQDNLVLTFTPAPTVNPGVSVTVCANTTGVPLNGIVNVATGGVWTTGSGTGTFSPSASNLNATFTPSATQIANGRATLTLTTTGNGTCNAVSATVVITIVPIPTVNAGTDVSVCTGTPTIGLSGTIANTTGATWSTSGTGTFTPNANTLNATYNPSAADNVNGNIITLTLTTDAGTCAPVNDQMSITFQTTPVSAGSDIPVCSNSLPIQLNGSGNGSWTGGNGTFSDPNSLSTTYMPAANEIPAPGSSPITVTLTLNGAAVGACIGGTDNVSIIISPGPDATAGSNQTICSNNGVVTLNGSVLTATGGKWFSDGTGSFANATNLSTTYTASPADTADGSIQLKLVTTGNGTCAADSSTLTLNFTPSPKVNAGLDQASCANAGAVTLNGSVTVVSGGTWSGGAGTFSPNANTLNASYTATAAEIAAGAVTLRLTSNIDPVNHCNQVFDEVRITFGAAPTTDAGTDQNICKNNPIAPLSGTFTVASGIQWSTSGTGSFSPNANDPNATYTASASDLTSSGVTITITTTGNGNCIPATDNMLITFTPTPIADAGVDISTCSNNRAVVITGNVTNAAGGSWTSSGTGTFIDANLLSTTYNASASDSAVGSVTLTLTTTGINNCNSVSDQLVITFTPAPIVNAGLDQSSCANAGAVSLNGMVTGVAPGGTWSNGAGTFSPSNTDLNAFYTPTAAEITAGSVTLILTSNPAPGNNCNPVTDAVTIYFGAAPTADAGVDQTICGDGSVTLDGKITVAAGSQWTTSGSGIFTPDATTLNAIYVPSSADTLAKTVTLTLETTGNGNCSPVSDFMVVTITPTPRVEAGTNQTVCADITSVTISGGVTVASGGTWKSSGTGTFGDADAISTTYTPSATDKASGSVFLTLTSTGNGQCSSYSDFITIFFTPAPTVNAGADRTICKDATSISISGSTTVATGGIWSTSGDGGFDNANQLATNYNPSANDKSAGSVTLTLTSSNQGTCNAVTDQLIISFTNAPTVAAGSDRTICTDKDSIRLGGQFTVSSDIVWSTSGNGTFSPSASDPNAIYNFSTTDLNQTNITLTLTTSGNGTCNPVTDNLVVDITPKPILDAGTDINICAGQSNITLSGSVSNYNIADGVSWSTNGTGTFDNINSLNSGYVPSPADLIKGGLIFTLTTTGGICKPASDVLATNIVPAPVAMVNAGLDQTVCSDVTEIQLAGFISGADYGAWSKPVTTGSDGVFIGNNSSDWATAKYEPTTAEITSKIVVLRLTTVGNGPICSAVFDDVRISFTDAPTVNAGPDQSICGDNAGIVALNGSFTVSTGGIWSTTGNGVFSLTPTITNPTYYPSPEDKATQSVNLVFTTTGNGTCKPKTDTLFVQIKRAPTLFAGVDQTLCANSIANIRSVITSAGGVQWSSSGSGTFGSNVALTTTYTPSAADTSAKEVNLIAVTTGNNGCTPVNDKIRISFSPVPIINAGADKTVCASNSIIDLSGWVANATGGRWSIASGTGRIISATSLTPTYLPSAGDTATGNVTLTISSTGNGRCTAVTDQVSIFLQPVPVVNMQSVIVCEPKDGAQLSGSINNALGGIWSTSGTGVFATNVSDMNGVYYPSPADVNAGFVTLTLESSGNGMCEPVSTSTLLNIDPMPIANAGQDHFVCPGATVVLSAVPSSEGDYKWSVINGSSVGNTPAVSVVANSITAYELVVTNAKGCISKDTVNVDVFTLPTLTLNPEYCLSTSLIIDGIPNPQPNVPGVYNWTLNGETVQGNNTPVISPIESGNYVLTFAFGTCSVSEPTRVNDHPKLTGDFIKDCIGKSTPITVKANESGLDYSWSTGQAGVDLSTITIPTVLADTTYYIATVTKNYPTISCSAKDSVRIIGIPTPILNLEKVDVCQGTVVVLNGRPMNIANLDSLYPSYEWFKDKAIIANQTNDTLTVNVTGEYKEIVKIDQCVAMDSAQINVNPNPTTTLPDYIKFCRRDDNKTVIDAGFVAGSTYLWTSPAGISLDSNNTATITVRREGTYEVLITNIYNCTLTDSIFVEDLCAPEVDGPNAIIPGDPNNGTFRIYGQYFKNFKLMIFNRWGEVIFETNNQKEGWDGTYHGQPMPIGVYPYIVTYDSEDPSINKSYKKEGSVTIIR